MGEPLVALRAGDRVLVGGDRYVAIGSELAAVFAAGDRLVAVHETGDLLHIPAAEHQIVDGALEAAAHAFELLGAVDDSQISQFFDHFAERLATEASFAPIVAANAADVASAAGRGRPTGRLELSPSMRRDMIDGLRTWRDLAGGRRQAVRVVEHGDWSVEEWRDPLGVVAFVFEGRPNVFADATGVLRTGNSVVFRIGSDALGTAEAIMAHAVHPALDAAGLPPGAVGLIASRSHAAGWALFADRRVSLAVARGSGAAVMQLGAVARQHGVPASLHGTGGAWLVAATTADIDRFRFAVRHSLDRKVCNTLNVCCIVADRAEDLVPAFLEAAGEAAAVRQCEPVIHRLEVDDPLLAHEWEWDAVPEVSLVIVDDVAQAVRMFNRFSPRFVASLISSDSDEAETFYRSIDAPFVGDGFTRWVDGQYALDQPELGLSNWQSGRLFGRGGILSGDSVYSLRLRARMRTPDVRR
ncbi:MAG: putative gamma-glutamyl phosphate reductase protein [Actinomycetota bacterium]